MSETDASRRDFLRAAVEDIQATIRFIDTKVAALLVALVVPLTQASKIIDAVYKIAKRAVSGDACPKVVLGLALIALVSWLLACLSSMATISTVSSPAKHVKKPHPTGVFYSANAYVRDLRESTRSPDEHLGLAPNTARQQSREFAFEHLKLIYIREAKLRYQLRAFWLTKAAVGFALLAIAIEVVMSL